MTVAKKVTRPFELFLFIIILLNFLFGPQIVTWAKSINYGNRYGMEAESFLSKLSTEGKSYIDGLDPAITKNKKEFELWGWAFLTIDNDLAPSDYQRTIVLFTEKNSFAFPVWDVPRKGVEEYFSYLGLNLQNSGFTISIPEGLLPPGTYRIGVLFYLDEQTEYFILTNRVIEKSKNSVGLK